MDVIPRRSFGERFVGAMRVDTSVYEEVEADTGATGQAAAVVALVAIAGAIGGGAGWLGALASAFLGWLIWSGVTYVVGDKLLGGTATWGELLRTIGFALAPGVLYVFGIVPILGWIVELIVGIWLLVTVVVAIRQALDFGTLRALLTALIGWIPYLVVRLLIGGLTGIRPDML